MLVLFSCGVAQFRRECYFRSRRVALSVATMPGFVALRQSFPLVFLCRRVPPFASISQSPHVGDTEVDLLFSGRKLGSYVNLPSGPGPNGVGNASLNNTNTSLEASLAAAAVEPPQSVQLAFAAGTLYCLTLTQCAPGVDLGGVIGSASASRRQNLTFTDSEASLSPWATPSPSRTQQRQSSAGGVDGYVVGLTAAPGVALSSPF